MARTLTRTVKTDVVVERGTCVVSVYQERRLKAGVDPAVENGVQGSAPEESYETVTLVDAIADPSVENGPRATGERFDALGYTPQQADALLDQIEELCTRAIKRANGLTG